MSRRVKRVREEGPFGVNIDGLGPVTKKNRSKAAEGNTGKPNLLPLDVLYIIFSLLPPRSLLALTYLNRIFRSILLSSETTFIWTRVRKSYEAPDPWEEMSEVQWVRLLFGDANCSLCRVKSVRKIDFSLMTRVCLACVKANGISKVQLKRAYPDEHSLLVDLVHPTSISQRASYYRQREIDRVLERVRKCADEEELEAYVKERKAYLERLVAHANLCYEWIADEPNRKTKEVHLAIDERFGAIKARLREMNFVDQDIEVIRDDVEVAKGRPLTERMWAQLKPRLAGVVFDSRVRRLLSDLCSPLSSTAYSHVINSPSGQTQPPAFLITRCDLIAQHYLSYKQSLPLLEWRKNMCPSVEAVWCLPSMRKIIALPDGVDVTSETIQNPPSMNKVNIFAQELRRGIQDLEYGLGHVYSFMGRPQKEAFKNWMDPDAKIRVPESDWRDILQDLATVQGRCKVCQRVFSSALIVIRHSTGPCFLRSDVLPRDLEFYSLADHTRSLDMFCSRSAAGLVWATLGAERMYDAKASEMDEVGRWYRCLRCSPRVDGGEKIHQGHEGFVGTWRECITHAFQELILTRGDSKHEVIPIDQGRDNKVTPYSQGYPLFPISDLTLNHEYMDQRRDNPLFQILTQEEVQGMNLKNERECWSCAHCTINAERLWTRQVMVKHLRDEHQIQDPRVPQDFFYAASDEA
ncbi:hypothetical protein PM082_022053 [Marasmius tenuissimus]|nr:hypothetical protein PM082_022053 [Marasmius tenuissimus]